MNFINYIVLKHKIFFLFFFKKFLFQDKHNTQIFIVFEDYQFFSTPNYKIDTVKSSN